MSATAAHQTESLPIARVYASALWNLAQRDGVTDEILQEYQELVTEILDKNALIERFLGAATIGSDAREAVLTKSVQGRVHELLYHFLLTLNRHNRLGLVRECGIALAELSDAQRGMQAV